MAGLKSRVKTLKELLDNALFYVSPRPIKIDERAAGLLDRDARARLARLADNLGGIDTWTDAAIDTAVRAFAEAEGAKLGQIAQPLRAALCGSTASPGIFEVAAALGREETLGRIHDAVSA
jgi:glutamyl-tRNA synthetase